MKIPIRLIVPEKKRQCYQVCLTKILPRGKKKRCDIVDFQAIVRIKKFFFVILS